MALDKSSLYTALYNGFLTIFQTPSVNFTAKAAEMATLISDSVDTYTKTGTVTFSSGNVNGTCAAPGAPLVAGNAANGTIS